MGLEYGGYKGETLVADTTLVIRIVEAKVAVATTVGLTLHRAGGLLMRVAECLDKVALEEAAETAGGTELQNFPRVLHMVVQVEDEDKIWEVTTTNSITGSSCIHCSYI
ncbi:cyclin-dependent kinase C-2 [Iris pallida]|uniref:Cyclin-dependent kinase C-2 n=1 Tax=Iris pallida TaxID=29817 RepID=A0AAX6I137_IRIPA|nr:cyclin-dependent kinase C-2 [Iris pallida]